MNRLIINTANEQLELALNKSGRVFSYVADSKTKHNEAMIPLISKLLTEHKLDIKEIDEFGVIVGPGSFTGIRVGIATVKAFRDALKAKARGINNLIYLYNLAKRQYKNIGFVAIIGSKDSYFVARELENQLYIYDHNLTLCELLKITNGQPVAMFNFDPNLNCNVVKPDAEILNKCFDNSCNTNLVPVYYQLSQAEREKLKKGSVTICKAKKLDLQAIVKLEEENILHSPMSKDVLTKCFADTNYTFYIAKFDKEIIGFVMLEITDEVNISSIAVDKKFRNLGVATKLLKRAQTLAKRRHISSLSLEVSNNNLTAYLVYEKFGFTIRRRRKNYYQDGSTCLEMVKVI